MTNYIEVNCDIQAGDRFLFRGIGEVQEDTTRELSVAGILSDGKLYGTRTDNGPRGLEERQFQIPYADALVMLEQNIWKPIL